MSNKKMTTTTTERPEHTLEREMVELLMKYVGKGMQVKTALHYAYKVLRGFPLLADISEMGE